MQHNEWRDGTPRAILGNYREPLSIFWVLQKSPTHQPPPRKRPRKKPLLVGVLPFSEGFPSKGRYIKGLNQNQPRRSQRLFPSGNWETISGRAEWRRSNQIPFLCLREPRTPGPRRHNCGIAMQELNRLPPKHPPESPSTADRSCPDTFPPESWRKKTPDNKWRKDRLTWRYPNPDPFRWPS